MPETPQQELENFFEFLYEHQQGLVYSPLKDPESGVWSEMFFNWPDDKHKLIRHVMMNTADKEVYIGLALYDHPKCNKDSIKGSYVVWTEYDGNSNSQSSNDDVPPPSYRIQSSILGHEHFYWKLDRFETDISVLEAINRAITYNTSADASSWDITQILRPPSTVNHKRDKPVLSLVKSEYVYNKELFSQLAIPPVVVGFVNTENLPEVDDVVRKYIWSDSEWSFFKSSVDFPFRSSSLMRLAHICAEKRMSDIECYAILDDADKRWGKFTARLDRHARICSLINTARLKHPLVLKPSNEIYVLDFEEMLESEIEIEWLIEGVLEKRGHVLLTGPPGIGKTQLSLRACICIATGRPFFDWKFGEPQKVLFISQEMGYAEIKYFIQKMAADLDDTERKLLKENFLIAPLGYGIPIDTKSGQAVIESLVKKHGPAGIFFDSLGISAEGELNEVNSKAISQFTSHLRVDYDLFVWFIHHNRKAQAQNKKPNKLDDVFGSTYVTAGATTVIGMWLDGGVIEIIGLKVRLAQPFERFKVTRTANLNFEKQAYTAPQGLVGKKELIEEVAEIEKEQGYNNDGNQFE